MKIPEHDIIDVKWLIARATFAAKPREEERGAAAEELFSELVELNGLHGIEISLADKGLKIVVPGGETTHISYDHGEFTGTEAFMTGKLRVEGNPVLGMQLGRILG